MGGWGVVGRYNERVESETKTCTKCGAVKPISEFHLEKRRMKPRSACKACDSARMREHYLNNKDYYSNFAREWRAKNREKANENSNRSKAKRRIEVHTAWLDQQGGKCVICQRPQDDPLEMHLDHCHRTGVARALLCKRCNYLLGACDDDETILSTAIEYLRAHRADPTAPKVHRKVAWWRSWPPGHSNQ